MKKVVKVVAVIIGILTLFIFLNNSSYLTKERTGDPVLLAHVGMAQTYPMDNIENDTCTAERIYEPDHPYIGNTIPSMEAAFREGADIVEFDIHPTTDGKFAIFHDWTLDCRTNGHGVTRNHTLEELKKLDVGYGYTADGGKTYPFRGKGVGMMPSLDEVLTHFPDKTFLINIKSNDQEEGEQLANYLSTYPKKRLDQLSVYGGNAPIHVLKEELPSLRVMSMETLKSCLISYESIGWTGYIPSTCKNTQLHIPEKYAPWLWGYPAKFLNRMESVNTKVVLVAGDGGWSEGFDNKKDFKRVPKNYDGILWTNRVDRIAEIVKE
ncbi:glycerophosphodiester phosphodiesterase family protein [Halobacillus sp. B29]|uniref:glycerophosphodiester phosphodiesterase family protein n=1 Tax=Halobacillus sp. B29 TaxID=3457432 RepID=UPI003FCE5711